MKLVRCGHCGGDYPVEEVRWISANRARWIMCVHCVTERYGDKEGPLVGSGAPGGVTVERVADEDLLTPGN